MNDIAKELNNQKAAEKSESASTDSITINRIESIEFVHVGFKYPIGLRMVCSYQEDSGKGLRSVEQWLGTMKYY